MRASRETGYPTSNMMLRAAGVRTGCGMSDGISIVTTLARAVRLGEMPVA
jgi:hypothetical protein